MFEPSVPQMGLLRVAKKDKKREMRSPVQFTHGFSQGQIFPLSPVVHSVWVCVKASVINILQFTSPPERITYSCGMHTLLCLLSTSVFVHFVCFPHFRQERNSKTLFLGPKHKHFNRCSCTAASRLEINDFLLL